MENLKKKKERTDLFSYLDSVLEVSLQKFNMGKKADEDRRSWGRLLKDTVHEYGFLMKDEELELRVQQLEEKLKNSILLPKEKRE